MLALKTVSGMLWFFWFVFVQPRSPKGFSRSLSDTGLQVGYREAQEHMWVSQDVEEEGSLTSGGRNMQWKWKKAAFLIINSRCFCCCSQPRLGPLSAGVGTDHCLLEKTKLLLNLYHDSCGREGTRLKILEAEVISLLNREVLGSRVKCFPLLCLGPSSAGVIQRVIVQKLWKVSVLCWFGSSARPGIFSSFNHYLFGWCLNQWLQAKHSLTC